MYFNIDSLKIECYILQLSYLLNVCSWDIKTVYLAIQCRFEGLLATTVLLWITVNIQLLAIQQYNQNFIQTQ